MSLRYASSSRNRSRWSQRQYGYDFRDSASRPKGSQSGRSSCLGTSSVPWSNSTVHVVALPRPLCPMTVPRAPVRRCSTRRVSWVLIDQPEVVKAPAHCLVGDAEPLGELAGRRELASHLRLRHEELRRKNVRLALERLRGGIEPDLLGSAESRCLDALEVLADPVAELVCEGEPPALRRL